MKKSQDPLDAEVHEMLDFYWKAAQRADKPGSAAKPARRSLKVAVSRKLSALRALRQAARADARTLARSSRRAG